MASNQVEKGFWQRGERVFAYLGENRTRYASVAQTPEGRLLILFTHQTRAQEEAGTGELWLLRRSRDGRWWEQPEPIYQGMAAEPRAYGTLTTLDSGRLIAPFVELDNRNASSQVQLLTSDDKGHTWESAPVAAEPLLWAAPCGRPFAWGDELILPLFGALDAAALQHTRLCCGLLRSRDGGRTWGDWSLLAGAEQTDEISCEFPAVLPLADGTILALFTARRLKAQPHLPLDVPQTLRRTSSSDGGHTWSPSEHLAVGCWPSLTRIDEQTVACCFAGWAGWGDMGLMFSSNGFRSISQRLPGHSFVNHGWLPGYGPTDGWGTGWARDPIPLPPVVPHLEGNWNAGHYGFSAGLALDEGPLLMVLGQRQRTQYDTQVPIEKERIETIAIERRGDQEPAGPTTPHGTPAAPWRLAEHWSVAEWQARTGEPLENAFVLQSGRQVRLQSATLIPDWHETWYNATLGHEKGYPVSILGYRIGREWAGKSLTRFAAAYMEDGSRTWREAGTNDSGPLHTAAFPGGNLIEESDGTLVTPVYGYQTGADIGIHLYTCTLVRSHDQGRTWGDWSIIACDEERRRNFSETALVPFADGTWVVFMCSECVYGVPYELITCRAVSSDRGRTWSAPEPCAAAGVYGCLALPDGGIAVAAQNTCGWGLTISYNYGRTWDYALPATYAPTRTGVLDEKTFWIYDQHGAIVSLYRRD